MFANDAKSQEKRHKNSYGFDSTPILLFQWSRLFQGVVSQAGTYLLTKTFHTQQSGIYKCEGGCHIDKVGDLVLYKDSCYFDYDHKHNESKQEQLADLITHIVLNWNPNGPIDSMLKSAADYIKVEVKELREAIEKMPGGNVFSGNSLSSFFDWNPFSEPPYNPEYRRWCMVNHGNMTEKEVDQMFADEDLGKKFKQQMNEMLKKVYGGAYFSSVMCCSPKRDDTGLKFWINTGTSTQIDGWKTKEEIEEFIKANKPYNKKN